MNKIELLKSAGIDVTDIHGIKTLNESYIEYAENLESNKLDLGFPKLYEVMRGIRTQELLTISAGTGAGKSALALNMMLNHAKNSGELTIYFSLEMSSVGIAERIIQIELDKYGFEVEKLFVEKDKAFLKECESLAETINNIVIINKRVDILAIPNIVKAIELHKGKKTKLICIDYIGLILNSKYNSINEYERLTDNMSKLYAYAKELNTAIINLSQVGRESIKSEEGIGLYSAKGSGEVENSSDFYLTLERVKENKKNSQDEITKLNSIQINNDLYLMKLTVHKNRRGSCAIIYLTFNRKNLRIKEFDNIDLL